MNSIEDTSGDRKYFIMTPRIVLYRARSPYDFILWTVIKDIAGEERECIISTPDLALLSIMSVGQVHKSRKRLIEDLLLTGKVIKDPGYPQPVWHLRIPDLWEDNIGWSKAYPTIAARLEFRRIQSDKELSQDESSINAEELSCGEKGTSCGEKGTTCGETKKSIKEDQKEDPIMGAKSAPDAASPGDPDSASIIKNLGAYKAIQAFEARGRSEPDLAGYPEDTRAIIGEFFKLWKVAIPAPSRKSGSQFSLWIKEARALLEACGEYGLEALRAYHDEWTALPDSKRFYPGRPGSLIYHINATAGKLRSKDIRKEERTESAAGWEAFREMWKYRFDREPTESDYLKYKGELNHG